MKILVLMPLEEQYVYAATGIYKNMPEDVQQITFAMPMFMEYLVTTKISNNWTFALYDALISAKNIYNAAEDRDLIIIGNISSDLKFDAVFNFQDIEKELDYKDLTIKKLLSLDAIKNDPVLFQPIAALHEAHESTFTLKNCEATADFLSSFIKTDPHLEQIEKTYQDKIKALKKGNNIKDLVS